MKLSLQKILNCWLICCWISCHFVNGATRDDDGDRGTMVQLYDDLISNYGPTTIRPVKNQASPVNVKMRMLVDLVVDVDEPRQQVTVLCSVKVVWTDEYLTWNASDYGGIDSFEVDVDKIWSPSVTLLTSVSPDFIQFNNRRVWVLSDGKLTWLSPVILTSACFFDVTLFPFDVQNCVFEFGSWINPGTVEELDYFWENNVTTFDRCRKDSVWQIVDDSVLKIYESYSSSDDAFAELHYYIMFGRQSGVYVLSIVIPSVLLSLCTMLIFLLPPQSGEKISFGITNLLAMLLFQEAVRASMPATGSSILANYICVMVVVACTSLIVEAIVLRMYNYGNTRIVRRWMQRLLLSDSEISAALLKGACDDASNLNESIMVISNGVFGAPGRLEDDEKKRQSSQSVDHPDHTELWKLVALSFEKKFAFVTLCVILGNIGITSLKMISLVMKRKYFS